MRSFALLLVGGVFLTAPVASAQVPVLQYTFDEPSGQAIDTGTPPAANGDLLGGAVRSSDTPSGTGSSIDLTDDAATYAHVLNGDADKLDGLSQLTLTTWLKVSDYTGGNNRLSAKQNASTFGGFSWNMNSTTNDGASTPADFRLGLFIGNNVSGTAPNFNSAFTTVDAGADDVWTFFAVTYDGTLASDNTRFYVGGLNTPVVQLGDSRTMLQLTAEGGPAPFGVGYTHAAPTADTSVIGLQDDVRVYNAALDATALDAIRLSNVPEPASLGVLAMGAAALLGRRRRA